MEKNEIKTELGFISNLEGIPQMDETGEHLREFLRAWQEAEDAHISVEPKPYNGIEILGCQHHPTQLTPNSSPEKNALLQQGIARAKKHENSLLATTPIRSANKHSLNRVTPLPRSKTVTQ